jgi:hypothetical protein
MAPKAVKGKQIKKVEYTVNENSPFSKEDGRELGQTCADICKKREIDAITNDILIEEAKAARKGSLLRQKFKIDDPQGAIDNFHKTMARKILGAIKVQVTYVDIETQEVTVETRKAYVNLPDEDGKRAYHPVAKVLSQPSMLKAAYEQFRTQANSFLNTAKSFKDPELAEMTEELQAIINKMNGKFRRR